MGQTLKRSFGSYLRLCRPPTAFVASGNFGFSYDALSRVPHSCRRQEWGFSLYPLSISAARPIGLQSAQLPGSREDSVSSLVAMKRVHLEAVRRVLAVLVFTLPLLFHSPSHKVTSVFYSSVVISNMMRQATLPSRPLLAPRAPAMRSFLLVHYVHVQLICILLVKPRPKVLNSRSLFSRACALFHFPYPVSPVFATLTKTAGCVPTIPIVELAARQSPLQSDSSSFFSNSCALFCAFLHSPKTQPFYFQAIPHSLRKTPGGVGRGVLSSVSGGRCAPRGVQRRGVSQILSCRFRVPSFARALLYFFPSSRPSAWRTRSCVN